MILFRNVILLIYSSNCAIIAQFCLDKTMRVFLTLSFLLFIQEILYNSHYFLQTFTADTVNLTQTFFKDSQIERRLYTLLLQQLIAVFQDKLCQFLTVHFLDTFVCVSVDNLFFSQNSHLFISHWKRKNSFIWLFQYL